MPTIAEAALRVSNAVAARDPIGFLDAVADVLREFPPEEVRRLADGMPPDFWDTMHRAVLELLEKSGSGGSGLH